MTTVELSPLELYKKIYKYSSAVDSIKAEAQEGYMMTSMEINDGVYAHFQGMEYPERGLVKMEDIWAVNIVKRLIVHALKLLPYLAPSLLVFLILPYKIKIKIINKLVVAFNDVAMKVLRPSILQDRHLTPMAKELLVGLNVFFKELGIDQNGQKLQVVNRETLAEIIVNIINFDNAYRYRIQDIIAETTKEKLMSPQKELDRLFRIQMKREVMDYPNPPVLPKLTKLQTKYAKKYNLNCYVIEGDIVHSLNVPIISKTKHFYSFARIILLHPKILKAYKVALQQVDLEKIKPDTYDWFWMCLRDGYKYFGKTKHERRMMINHLKVCKPIKIPT